MADQVVRVCPMNDLGESRPLRVETADGTGVVLVRIGNDVYALDDRCSHQNVRLSEGDVWPDTAEIECHRHGSTFSLRTGEALVLPATAPVRTHRVTVEEGYVCLEVSP